jgi:tol-pal system beta propeller repeat protein TolB
VNNVQLYVMNADGSNQHRLWAEKEVGDFLGPEWSPDGKQIVCYSNRGACRLQIWIVNADGTDMQNVSNAFTSNNSRPSWSPDGSKIAFVSDRDGNSEIYVMNADGSNQTRLTHDNADDVMPKWSPDGKQIVFESNRAGINTLYIMNADGSDVKRVFANPQFDATPAFGNGGKRLYFSSLRTHNWELYYHDMATGEDHPLTAIGRGYNRFPQWTPLEK